MSELRLMCPWEWEKGRMAAYAEKQYSANPYNAGDVIRHVAWLSGFNAAREEIKHDHAS